MFDYPYLNIVLYPGSTGGKFLINCLSLNDRAVFQHRELAQKQLDGKFNVNDKIKYIHKHLEIAKQENAWKDLSLGTGQLFGIPPEYYANTFPEFIKRKLNTPLIRECMSNKLHLFITTHDFLVLEHQLEIWKNAKIVVFKNFKNFRDNRTGGTTRGGGRQLKQYWDIIKSEEWPDQPPTDFKLYEQLPQHIKDDLENKYENKIYELLKDIEELIMLWHAYLKDWKKSIDFFEFDVDYAYDNSENFYKTYVQVCNYLNLPHTDQTIITRYFDEWKTCITPIMPVHPTLEKKSVPSTAGIV